MVLTEYKRLWQTQFAISNKFWVNTDILRKKYLQTALNCFVNGLFGSHGHPPRMTATRCDRTNRNSDWKETGQKLSVGTSGQLVQRKFE